ncbi:MAG: PEP-CTERM sorting domain-containing protein [Deltaproteobacteria bacterium]|nr:PEP-CTERM sorting domain-containing protein [Deltaproteobacteria bacterium]
MAGFRTALENPAFFGPTGVVDETINTATLNTVNAATLSGVDMFIGGWVGDGDAPAFSAAVMNFFLGGGDLFLLQDDPNHDALGSMLGISTTPSSGTVSNGGAPFFDGPFGIATDVTQHYLTGQLDPLAVADNNGNIVGTNESGQVTSAYWGAGEYAADAGALFIIADIDMIATTSNGSGGYNGAVYGSALGDLNDNAIYALNTFSFLKDGEAIPPNPVPEPATMLLFGTGLVGLVGSRLRRKKK